jgi:transposase
MRPKGSAAQLEYRRHLAGKLLAQGKGVREIARLFDVVPASVSRWKQALEHGGAHALLAKPHTGSKPRLSRTQKARLLATLQQGPRKEGYPTERWTCPQVAEVIRRHFRVRYHPAHVWRLLRALGWPPRPSRRPAREREMGASVRRRRRAESRRKKPNRAG